VVLKSAASKCQSPARISQEGTKPSAPLDHDPSEGSGEPIVRSIDIEAVEDLAGLQRVELRKELAELLLAVRVPDLVVLSRAEAAGQRRDDRGLDLGGDASRRGCR
jgi:hypothetical protein